MSTSESSQSTFRVAAAVLLGVSLLSVTQAAPMNPIANNHPHGKAHGTTSNQNCPPFFRRETQYAGQCAPVQFARVWHVAPKTRAATVTTVNNQNSEVACYLSILETGTAFQQFTWVSTTSACTFTAGGAIDTGSVATHPTSDNIIATNYAGTCASIKFSAGVPGIPCQNVQVTGGNNPVAISVVGNGNQPFTIGKALALAHIQ